MHHGPLETNPVHELSRIKIVSSGVRAEIRSTKSIDGGSPIDLVIVHETAGAEDYPGTKVLVLSMESAQILRKELDRILPNI